MSKNHTESEIRNIIASNLKLIEPDMVLIDKEHYIPNCRGTKGFIDILAKDKDGHLVVIEVKKSNVTSREALHEIFKYLEGIKSNKGLKDEEIRLLIISTEWKELLIPFSSLCKNSSINIQGYSIEINERGTILSVREVIPIVYNDERIFCEHHMLRAYTTRTKLKQGIKEHIAAFENKKVDDYILVILEAPEGHREKELQAIERQYSKISPEYSEEMISWVRDRYPSYDFIIYSAVQLQTEDKYWEIIKKDDDKYEEVLEIIEDYVDEDRINTLHDYAIDIVEPIPTCDTAQIGYAAKLDDYIYNQNWAVQKIIRGKIFDNEFLDDEIILDELLGSQGRTRQIYFKEFDSKNRTAILKMKKEVGYCLQDNKQWKIPIIDIFESFIDKMDKEPFKGKIYIYNPMHILYTIYLMVSTNNIMEWAPNFYIVIENRDYTTLYFGDMKYTRNVKSFDQIKAEYFGADLFELAFSLTWGGYLHNDLDIAKDLGLVYRVYKVEITKAGENYYEYVDYDFKACDKVCPLDDLRLYLNREKHTVKKIVDLFEKDLQDKGYNFM